jgi:hypothetical protein
MKPEQVALNQKTYAAIYRERPDLKDKIKASGFTRRDIACEMGMTAGCLNMKLNGYQRFTPEQEALLLKLCEVSNDE